MLSFKPAVTCLLDQICTATSIKVRYLPRWATRTPKQVFLPEALKNTFENNKMKSQLKEDNQLLLENNTNKIRRDRNYDRKLMTVRTQKLKKEKVDMLETTIDSDGNLIYTKMGHKDARISNILSGIKSSSTLKKQDLIMLEGKRLIKDALQSGCKLKYLLFSQKNDVEEIKEDLPKFGSHLYKMPYKEMQNWSDLTTNPGLMGIFETPKHKHTVNYSVPVSVVCDNVREPGNLGAILRVCAAAGCKTVILTKGCCDPWNTKVLRSAMGAHFKLNIEKIELAELTNKYSRILIADSNIVADEDKIEVKNYSSLSFQSSEDILLIVGGETEGISKKAYSFAAENNGIRVHIPLSNNINSLNSGVALGILIFEIKRQLT